MIEDLDAFMAGCEEATKDLPRYRDLGVDGQPLSDAEEELLDHAWSQIATDDRAPLVADLTQAA